MEGLGAGLSILGGGFGLVAILAVAFVYFRGSADKATISSQGNLLASRKEEIEDLTRRVATLEAERDALRRAVEQIKGIDHLQHTVDHLQASVDANGSDIKAIRTRVELGR